MDIFLLVAGLPTVIFLGLAMLPAGRAALIGHVAVAVVAGLLALSLLPLDPPQGPDDWFHGLELVPVYAAAVGVPLIGAAQLWRWRRMQRGRKPYYLVALLVCALPILFLISRM